MLTLLGRLRRVRQAPKTAALGGAGSHPLWPARRVSAGISVAGPQDPVQFGLGTCLAGQRRRCLVQLPGDVEFIELNLGVFRGHGGTGFAADMPLADQVCSRVRRRWPTCSVAVRTHRLCERFTEAVVPEGGSPGQDRLGYRAFCRADRRVADLELHRRARRQPSAAREAPLSSITTVFLSRYVYRGG